MGFVRRLVEESSKQLKEVAKHMNETMKELERQANEAHSQRQQGSSSSTHRTDTNYNYNYIYPTNNNEIVQQETIGESRPLTFAELESQENQLRNMYRQLIDDQIRQAEERITTTGEIGTKNNMMYVNDPYVQTPNNVNYTLPVDPIAQEQQLRNTRQKLIDDQIRRADESITRMGAIGTSNNVVYVNNNNPNVQTPSYVVDPISQEQQLRNMRRKLIDDQIRRADESMMRMGVIGTDNHLVYTNDTLGNIR